MLLNLAATLSLLYIVFASLLLAFLCGIDRVIELVTGRRRDIAPAAYRAAFPDDEPPADIEAEIHRGFDWRVNFCPACWCDFLERTGTDPRDVDDPGEPLLCDSHAEEVAAWLVREPRAASRWLASTMFYTTQKEAH